MICSNYFLIDLIHTRWRCAQLSTKWHKEKALLLAHVHVLHILRQHYVLQTAAWDLLHGAHASSHGARTGCDARLMHRQRCDC